MKKIFCILVLSFLLFASEALAYGHHFDDIASGGPYVATRKRIQNFAGKFKLAEEDVKKPMMLVIHNGFGDQPGFEWLRIFLCGDIKTNLDKYEEPEGDLIFDQNYVQQHTITLDITDLVQEGVNTILIEGKGRKGACLSWTLNSTISPELSPINPTETFAGAKLTLSGKGFSLDKNENQVTINDRELEVVSSSRGNLTVKIPETIKSGEGNLVVTTHGIKSKPYTLLVKVKPNSH